MDDVAGEMSITQKGISYRNLVTIIAAGLLDRELALPEMIYDGSLHKVACESDKVSVL